ncbi:hypothetical protein DRW41_09790 [Neobacillus piezotolerans]|uniref:Lipoprotein n=1 Tax=Neobacillus piezotolerans TaxID=2259171 RepID=A0A3D8GRY5_9BACI|nr:hypothetical protein [Neobacillus piezotolerans]RDU36979.1 hypothetical protein DRW41_09790 [Neobacillus piezotolerans]
MKKYLPIMFLILLLLVSCQSIVSNSMPGNGEEGNFDTNYLNNSKEDSLKANQKKDLYLQIGLPGEKLLNISVDKVPVLNSYLEQFEDKKNELNRMQGKYLFTYNQKDYILLNYSCGTKLCNHLLLEHNEGKLQSLEMAELSFMQDSKLNNNYIAFLFGKSEGADVLRNQVIIVDLKRFQEIFPPDDLKILCSFEFPIQKIEWNDGALIANVANITDSTYEGLKEWNMKKTTQQLKWKIQ